MRINVHSEGFRLTPQLRSAVVSRLLSALSPFGAHIQLVVVRLRAGTGHGQPDTPLCEVAVSLHPSGEVRAQAEDAQMAVAIDRAANAVAVQSNAKYLGCNRHPAHLPPRRRRWLSRARDGAGRQPNHTATT